MESLLLRPGSPAVVPVFLGAEPPTVLVLERARLPLPPLPHWPRASGLGAGAVGPGGIVGLVVAGPGFGEGSS